MMARDSSAEGWYPTSAKEARSVGWDFYYMQPPPMPHLKTNGVWVPWEDVFGPGPLIQVPVSSAASLEQDGPTPNYSGASSQSTLAPVRPPTAPARGRAGWFGIAYDTYRGNASGYTVQNPDNGLHIGVRIGMEGSSPSHNVTYSVLLERIAEANAFVKEMKRNNWSKKFSRSDDLLSINDLRGSGANIFNNVQLGLLMLHGTYGTTPDYTISGAKQMYFPITSGGSAQYLRMSEMNLGSAATNGLKWMAIDACNSMYQPNWADMLNHGVHPNNSDLHLLLGTDSVSYTDPTRQKYWARYMTSGKIVLSPMTIEDAWFQAARDAFAATGYNYTNAIYFAVGGDAACTGDMLQTNSPPTGSPYYASVQVWP